MRILKGASNLLRTIVGKKINACRAPGFSVIPGCEWFFDTLIDQGIEIDCSIFPAPRAHGGFPTFGCATPVVIEAATGTLKEFPINTYNLFGKNLIFPGGGYFRLLPLWLLKHLMSQSDYVMTYFHPRDFDPEQPMLKELPLFRKFKSYYGLKNAAGKLRVLLSAFDFVISKLR